MESNQYQLKENENRGNLKLDLKNKTVTMGSYQYQLKVNKKQD